MKHVIKKVSKFAAVAACILMMASAVLFVVPVTGSHTGYMNAAALEGYNEDGTLRGFVLPAEQSQPASVKAAEVKEPFALDGMQMVYIGFIAAGVLISAGLVVYWLKIAK